MIVSRNFLLEFFPDLEKYSPEKMAEALFRSGVEVERWEELFRPTGLFYGIVRSCEKIKDSDRLSLCTVEVPAKGATFRIVCGASNVRRDLKTVVSLPGAVLQNGRVTIEKTRIRGVDSEGMLCSYADLHRSDLLNRSFDQDGIIELHRGWDIGRDFSPSDLGLDDVVFLLSIPANRPDLNCVWGLAHELAKNLNCPNSIRELGVPHPDNGNLWDLKRILLSNNFVCGDYRENLNSYVHHAFNEFIFPKEEFQIKTKSEYFSRLCEDYLRSVGFHDRREYSGRDRYLSFVPIVNLDWGEISSILCLDSSAMGEVVARLGKFQFGFSPDGSVVFPPPWRTDIGNNRDFMEEILRMVDVGSAGECPPPTRAISVDNSHTLAIESIREFFRNRNFFECVTFNLHRETEGEEKISNPISARHVSLRSHALFELLEVLVRNAKRKNDPRPIFEVVEIWGEGWTLNLLVPETDDSFPLNSTKINNDLYDLRPLLKRALSYLNRKIKFVPGGENPLFHPMNLLDILDFGGEKIGSMGYMRQRDLNANVLGAVVKLPRKAFGGYVVPAFSEFPVSVKDVSIEATDPDMGIGEIMSSLEGRNLKKIDLVERYEANGMVSHLLRLRFQSDEGTLTKADIDAAMEEIYSRLREMKVKVR